MSPQPDPTEKKQLKDRHFSSDAEVIAAAETWLDRQPSEIFFEWLAKVKSLVAVACFLPARAKDVSAPWYCLKCNNSVFYFSFYVQSGNGFSGPEHVAVC